MRRAVRRLRTGRQSTPTPRDFIEHANIEPVIGDCSRASNRRCPRPMTATRAGFAAIGRSLRLLKPGHRQSFGVFFHGIANVPRRHRVVFRKGRRTDRNTKDAAVARCAASVESRSDRSSRSNNTVICSGRLGHFQKTPCPRSSRKIGLCSSPCRSKNSAGPRSKASAVFPSERSQLAGDLAGNRPRVPAVIGIAH